MGKARKPDPAVIREAEARGVDAVRRFLAMHGGSHSDASLSAFGRTVPRRWELEQWVKRKDARAARWIKAGVILAGAAAVASGIAAWEGWPAAPSPSIAVAPPLNPGTTP